MRLYVDSSALVKRGIREVASDELDELLTSFSADACFSSSLAWVEVSRALRSRLESTDPARVVRLIDDALSAVNQVPINQFVLGYARRIGSPQLRSLDAIHLASAVVVDAELFVAYDHRLLATAQEMGFATASPGAS